MRQPYAGGAARVCGFAGSPQRWSRGTELHVNRSRVYGSRVPTLLLVNGPNLNLLGTREPEIYGSATLADIEQLVRETAEEFGHEVRAVQSNHEGVLIDAIHAAREDCVAIVINPAGLTHTSVILRDALAAVALPVVEVHISDVYKREKFRRKSYLKDIATTSIVGHGVEGYAEATRFLLGRK